MKELRRSDYFRQRYYKKTFKKFDNLQMYQPLDEYSSKTIQLYLEKCAIKNCITYQNFVRIYKV